MDIRQRTIDPNFAVPEGLEFTHTENTEFSDYEFEDSIELDIQDEYGIEETEIGDEQDEDALEAPEYITVVSQKVRTAPDGTQVVDVEIEVEDVVGIFKYDVRMTKD